MEISVCLTDLGELSLSSNVDIYSNWDNFTNPIYINVPVSSLYGANCSFIATVPLGTTLIQIFDPIVNCTSTVVVISSNYCLDCNLGFDVFSSNTVSQIIAGNLVDNCSTTTITDYIIDWYGPNSSTNIGYTSGFGTEFIGYSFTHPLTGNSTIFAQSGTYFPKIRKIKINGIVYTQSGGTGSALANLDCITATTITVLPFTCTNGTSSISAYTHEVNFQGVGNVPPPPLQATIILSSTTKYLAWAFNGEEFPDKLRFTFLGVSYSTPIVFEELTTGWNSQINVGNFNPLVQEKSGRTWSDAFIKKINVLTGLTINDGDKILIDVVPSQITNETNWSLYFNSCLTTYDCVSCLLDTPIPYQIIGSSINANNSACSTEISFQMSGCTYNDIVYSDLYQHLGLGVYSLYPNAQPFINQTSGGFYTPYSQNNHQIWINFGQTTYNFLINLFANNFNCSWVAIYPQPTSCIIKDNNFIRYEKSNIGVGGTGIFKMTFGDVTDFNFYIDKINQVRNFVLTGSTTPLCDGLFSTNPNDCQYYRLFGIRVPYNIPEQTANCSDNIQMYTYYFHVSSVLTTGTTGTQYTIELTMPTIVNTYPNINCSNCYIFPNFFYDRINNSSTGTTGSIIDIQTNNGSKYEDPCEAFIFCCPSNTSQLVLNLQDFWALPKYCNETYMYSGSPLTLIPSLTAETCDFTGRAFLSSNYPSNYDPNLNGGSYVKQVLNYRIIGTDPDDLENNFSIQTQTIVNGFPLGLYFDIYTVVGGVVTYSDPTYII